MNRRMGRQADEVRAGCTNEDPAFNPDQIAAMIEQIRTARSEGIVTNYLREASRKCHL